MPVEGAKRDRARAAAQAYSYPLLLKHMLANAMRDAPLQEIVYRDRFRLNYLELGERVARLANCLVGLGLGEGSTVGVLDWDSHRYLEAYFAVPGIGAALHTVNVRLTPEQLLYTINHAEDDILLVHEDFLPLIEPIRDRLETVKAVILLTDRSAMPQTSMALDGEYESLLANSQARFEFPDLDENTIATIFYTTGTTGLPKGVFFSHRQLFIHTITVAAAFGCATVQGRLHRGDVYMPLTPMFHVHAWGVPYVSTMLGLKQVYPGKYEPEMLVRLIEIEKVTFTHGVPTVLHMLLEATEGRDIDLGKLKMIVGGSALSVGLAERALARGIDVFNGYGMSETCPVLSLGQVNPELGPYEDPLQVDLRATAGRAIPFVDIRIEKTDSDDQPELENGEIVVRAPWLTQGYLRDEQASDELWRAGYLHTGDIGTIGEDGYLRISDRAKDVIKCGGEWISSLELESAVSTLPDVSEVAAIAVPDRKWGERPCVLIVPKADGGNALDKKTIVSLFAGHAKSGTLPRNVILADVRIVDQLPKTSVGKLDKKRMREIQASKA